MVAQTSESNTTNKKQALNIIEAGDHEGHTLENTYKIYFIFYIIDNQIVILSKIISINLQRNFYSNIKFVKLTTFLIIFTKIQILALKCKD